MKHPHPDIHHATSCAGKQAFASHDLAQQVVRRSASRKDARLSIYRCAHCHQWHIGNASIPRHQRRGDH